MKSILNRLIEYQSLSKAEAKDILIRIGKGEFNEAQIASFISIYMMRSITVDELDGFRLALLELCKPIDFDGIPTTDMCGTGGDGKNTFNISTISSFVVAGAGVKVTKHGNYGVSSHCGSSNVMEYLGYEFTNDQDTLAKQLDESNICILHAPLFHPAMAEVGPIRRMLGMKTFFNMLGPLVNPCLPTHQSVGVFNLELARLYNYLLQGIDKKFSIVHALDGYDEVSLTGDTKVITNEKNTVLSPADFKTSVLKPEDLYGGESVKEAADIFVKILSGEASKEQRSVVLANAGLAISNYKNIPLSQAIDEAGESLDSGTAYQKLKTLIN
jgi:anthranilate phosphoribosyltransferase